MAILLITHDLGVVAEMPTRWRDVRRPHRRGRAAASRTRAGCSTCLPGKSHAAGQPRPARLFAIRGQVSSPLAPPPGCAFEPRCDHALAHCRDAMPALVDTAPQRQARCVLVPAARDA
jgi:peptide/nickel transport system ATP-binding protein